MEIREEDIVILLILLFLIFVGVVLILFFIKRRNQEKKILQKQQNVWVRNGVDVKKQAKVAGTGKSFGKNAEYYGTMCVNSSALDVWKIVLIGQSDGERQEYELRDYIILGRGASSQCQKNRVEISNSRRVSRNHCKIYIQEQRLWIEDLGSGNHTYVNGRRADAPCALKSGDVIKLGDGIWKFEYSRRRCGHR